MRIIVCFYLEKNAWDPRDAELVDLALAAMVSVELVFVGVGVTLAFKIAKMTDRPPIGWVFLTLSFATAFIRSLVFLLIYLSAVAAEPWAMVGQVIGLPIIILVFLGVFFMYRDFRKQLKTRQALILVPAEQKQAVD